MLRSVKHIALLQYIVLRLWPHHWCGLKNFCRVGLLSVFLISLYTSILKTTFHPVHWKFSIFILFLEPSKPVHKVDSYGPVSLLPLCSILSERLVYNRILSILESATSFFFTNVVSDPAIQQHNNYEGWSTTHLFWAGVVWE